MVNNNNNKKNKKHKDDSSNSLVFGRWPQTKKQKNKYAILNPIESWA